MGNKDTSTDFFKPLKKFLSSIHYAVKKRKLNKKRKFEIRATKEKYLSQLKYGELLQIYQTFFEKDAKKKI